METKQLNKLTESNTKLQLVRLTYNNIESITDEFVVYRENDAYNVINIDAEGDFVSKYSCCRTYLENNIKIFSYMDDKSGITILDTNNNVIYIIEGLFYRADVKYGVCIVQIFKMDDSFKHSVIIIRENESKIALNIDLKEPPLIPFSSQAKIQMLTDDDEVYGINKLGGIMKMNSCNWETINGPDITYS